MTNLLADLIVAFLLVLTSSWCALLYRRLHRLRVERSDIETFLAAVDGAVSRAELAIAGIRASATEAQNRLGVEQQAIEHRVVELNRLIESAGRMARRVEHAVHQGARAMAEDAIQHDRSIGSGDRPKPEVDQSAADAMRQRSDPATSRPRIEAELAKLLERLR